MDPEHTFIRVQERFSRVLTPKVRAALEYIYLFVAITLFCVLVVMHANYVQQPGCSSEFAGFEMTEAQLVQIKITSAGLCSLNDSDSNVVDVPSVDTAINKLEVSNMDDDGLTVSAAKFWLNWIGSNARKGKLALKFWRTDMEPVEHQAESSVSGQSFKPTIDSVASNIDKEERRNSFPLSAKEAFKPAIIHLGKKWSRRFSFIWRHAMQILGNFHKLWNIAGIHLILDVPKLMHVLYLDRVHSYAAQWLENRSEAFEPTYLYTMEKGYFLLPEADKFRHNIRTVNICISAQHPCFGNRWQQLLINKFVGYDTILMNSLLHTPGQATSQLPRSDARKRTTPPTPTESRTGLAVRILNKHGLRPGSAQTGTSSPPTVQVPVLGQTSAPAARVDVPASTSAPAPAAEKDKSAATSAEEPPAAKRRKVAPEVPGPSRGSLSKVRAMVSDSTTLKWEGAMTSLSNSDAIHLVRKLASQMALLLSDKTPLLLESEKVCTTLKEKLEEANTKLATALFERDSLKSEKRRWNEVLNLEKAKGASLELKLRADLEEASNQRDAALRRAEAAEKDLEEARKAAIASEERFEAKLADARRDIEDIGKGIQFDFLTTYSELRVRDIPFESLLFPEYLHVLAEELGQPLPPNVPRTYFGMEDEDAPGAAEAPPHPVGTETPLAPIDDGVPSPPADEQPPLVEEQPPPPPTA